MNLRNRHKKYNTVEFMVDNILLPDYWLVAPATTREELVQYFDHVLGNLYAPMKMHIKHGRLRVCVTKMHNDKPIKVAIYHSRVDDED